MAGTGLNPGLAQADWNVPTATGSYAINPTDFKVLQIVATRRRLAAENAVGKCTTALLFAAAGCKEVPPGPKDEFRLGATQFWIAQVAKLIEAGEIGDAATLIVYDRFCLIPR